MAKKGGAGGGVEHGGFRVCSGFRHGNLVCILRDREKKKKHEINKQKGTQKIQKQKTNPPMLARKPPLQVLPGLLRVLGLWLGPVPRVHPAEAVADPVSSARTGR